MRAFSKKSESDGKMAAIIKVTPKSKNIAREAIDYDKKFTERNFMTSTQAMSQYCLNAQHLKSLTLYYRRNPHLNNFTSIPFLLRKQVESKAIEVYGSLDNVGKLITEREERLARLKNSYSSFSKLIKKYHSMNKIFNKVEDPPMNSEQTSNEVKLSKISPERAIWLAIVVNGLNFVMKCLCYSFTASPSMFAESVHSLADTLNQIILAYGLSASKKRPDIEHPYGYLNMKHVTSLISGVGIFFFGCGLSLYHAISSIIFPALTQYQNPSLSILILLTSFLSESFTLYIAIKALRRSSALKGLSSLDYALSAQDPNLSVIILEDMAAVLGIVIASIAMAISYTFDLAIIDAIGSLGIGSLLGLVAFFIIKSNSNVLIGKSIPVDLQQEICRQLETDIMIRAIHDVKATHMGGNLIRFKAEVDIDGREVTKAYLNQKDLTSLLVEAQEIKDVAAIQAFLLKHGENIVDLVGAEIDRIEQKIVKDHPDIRHVDLEIL